MRWAISRTTDIQTNLGTFGLAASVPASAFGVYPAPPSNKSVSNITG